jgi:lipopolysaccharide export system permease protein
MYKQIKQQRTQMDIYTDSNAVLTCAPMSHTRIYRYIIKEISGPTLLSLLIFTFVLLMGRIPKLMELVINKGVPFTEIVRLFGYLLPTFFTVTFPLSFLLGILLAFGRISADSEYIALKASGVSLYTLIKPVFALAIVFTIATGLITNIVEPASKTAFRAKLFEIASSSAGFDLSPGVFNDNFPGIVLYARAVDQQNNKMYNVFISDERDSSVPTIITAKEGFLISDKKQLSMVLRLKNGSIHRTPQEKQENLYQTINFSNYDINIDIASQTKTSSRSRSKSELSWTELRTTLAKTSSEKTRLRIEAELSERIVIAFAPLVLLLVGAPLGLQSQRSGKGAGFTMALVVFLVYYILLSLAGTVAEGGTIPAYIIYWLPNLIFLIGGLYFVYCTANEKSSKFLRKLSTLRQSLLTTLRKKGAKK